MASSRDRYFVPDLTPRDRPELKGVRFRYVFIAESPHISEITPEDKSERRPLCGAAGKAWWGALSEIIEGDENEDVSLGRLLEFCRRHRIAVMNATQVPMDPKILKHIEDPACDPMRTLGFSKALGPDHYRKAKDPARAKALANLRDRLLDPALEGSRLIPLGNDADWFVTRALTENEREERAELRIAHPSAWWRRGGYFGKEAKKRLKKLFS